MTVNESFPTLEDVESGKFQIMRTVVRVQTGYWHDERGLHIKKTIRYLKRECLHNLLKEDCHAVGADEVAARIQNLHSVEDGLYTIEITNEHRDHETGDIKDYDYILVPYTKEEE